MLFHETCPRCLLRPAPTASGAPCTCASVQLAAQWPTGKCMGCDAGWWGCQLGRAVQVLSCAAYSLQGRRLRLLPTRLLPSAILYHITCCIWLRLSSGSPLIQLFCTPYRLAAPGSARWRTGRRAGTSGIARRWQLWRRAAAAAAAAAELRVFFSIAAPSALRPFTLMSGVPVLKVAPCTDKTHCHYNATHRGSRPAAATKAGAS